MGWAGHTTDIVNMKVFVCEKSLAKCALTHVSLQGKADLEEKKGVGLGNVLLVSAVSWAVYSI